MIAQRVQANYGFLNCVRLTDGTLFSLSSKPRHYVEDYYIRSIVVGWPGSIHDNRVWMNSPMLAKARIKNEHCIRLLKMRFHYLRKTRFKLNKAHEALNSPLPGDAKGDERQDQLLAYFLEM
ncbi:uncharacterized protein PITG_15314 [Phytophthora infestans T30-4]|uniref:DDE Tnp4 domain-containing protein n=1 Tax=Phytophthora infestans (strain T30-4) TaxID=403677 RepID=D0NQE9_PHYIT|nr:uncharacterized protein PITG_15314 [Phytophthora infestans T30-4]EEY62881.1 conserved hypothetical protein [Phytophthora infestans T30-4]|eukprot:XP_002898756.1 conserved hypothetical protein [Phytophthora infestans T30-4]